MYQLSPKRLGVWRSEWRAKGDLAFPGKGSQPQGKLKADRISELERKIGQQTMEIDFLKKALRRFREHPLPVAVNGGTDCMSKSKRRAKRGAIVNGRCRAAGISRQATTVSGNAEKPSVRI
jgi:hypothetical protein